MVSHSEDGTLVFASILVSEKETRYNPFLPFGRTYSIGSGGVVPSRVNGPSSPDQVSRRSAAEIS